MELKTPLYDKHLAAGGKIVPFAGYLLPVQYGTGVIAEHQAVRQACGLFDVSHMGEFIVQGPDALAYLNGLLSNDYTSLQPGRVRYGILCLPSGGVLDDLLVHCVGPEEYFIVVNAANRLRDAEWFKGHLAMNATFTDVSDQFAELALQGPKAEAILSRLAGPADIPQKYYSFSKSLLVAGIECLVARTGYTGEVGFELYVRPEDAPALWDQLLAAGKEDGLIPCGLGARDTLRLEAGMPLYGHEMNEQITPWEAGLDFGVKTDKEFIGRDAIVKIGRPRQRIGLQVVGRGVVREHQDVYANGQIIGHTTSGTFCPYLNGGYAMALVQTDAVRPGDQVEVDVRGRRVTCAVLESPVFYKRK